MFRHMCVPRDTSVLRYCLFGNGGKLPNSLERQTLATCEKYHISYFFSFLASDDTRFIPLFALPRSVPTTCLYTVFIFINKQLSISRDSQSCDCIFGFHRKE